MKTILRFVLAVIVLCTVSLQGADTNSPAVLSITPAPGSVVSNFTRVTVVFDEPVAGVLNWNVLVNGRDPVSVSDIGSTNFTFSFTQPAGGVVTLTWDPDQEITDMSGNSFAGGAPWTYTVVDTIAPTVLKVLPEVGARVSKLTQVSVLFSEPITGIRASALIVNQEPAFSVTGAGAGPYTFEFEQPSGGTVEFTWASGRISDLVSNMFGGAGWSVTLDPGFVPTVRINEFLAAAISTNGLKDEFGEVQDWIELYNYGASPVNITGFSLSDDAADADRWSFPSYTMSAGEYLLVLASGLDRKNPTGTNKFHTNFKLNSLDGYLGLFNAELPRVALTEFKPNYSEQRNDYSYGLTTLGEWRYFAVPTLAAANGNSLISEVLPAVHFSVDRGFFNAPFTLHLTVAKPEASIRYTLDGSEPTLGSGFPYTNALTISNITVLRAAAFAANKLPSLTETRTYMFLKQVLVQSNTPPGYPVGTTAWSSYPSDYEMDPEIVTNSIYGPMMENALKGLPTMSLVIKVDDMFGAANGIYTHPEPSDSQRYLWERPCSIEYMHPDGQKGFQIDCGIRVQGNASRTPQKTPKHPFRLMFKGKYGAGKLDYPVYPDSPVASFDTLVLRSDFNNSWVHWEAAQRLRGTRIRDAWTKDTLREMGQPSGHSAHFHLYINGLYWGVYDFGERVDAAFAASYLGGEKEQYDAIASKPTEAVDGDLTAYNTMTSFIRNNSMAVLTNYSEAQQMLDMPNFIDYMLLNFYGANQDWGADGNWNAIRVRTPEGKFKYVAWDGERLIEGNNDNRVTSTDLPSNLHPSLMNSPEYRLDFADRVQKHLFNNGALTTNAVTARWQKRVQQLDYPIVAESARWGDYRRDVHQYSGGPYLLYTRNDHWLPEVTRMVTNYFPLRQGIFLQQLASAGLFPSVSAPVLSQHGGRVSQGTVITMTGNPTMYYTTNGADPRVYGSGALSSSAIAYSNQTIVVNASVVIKARVYTGVTWSALTEAIFTVGDLLPPLKVTEIMYNPLGGDNFEYIELQNIGGTPLDVGAFHFDGITYQFPVGRVLNPGERVLLGSNNDTNAWMLRYPGVAVEGWFTGRLSNNGEQIRILNSSNQVVLLVDFKASGGWPTLANGYGYSLEIIDPAADPNDPANWYASSVLNGTPGLAGQAPPAAGPVVVNEVMADNQNAVNHEESFPDWVELYNSGTASIDLGGWSMSDDGNPRKFVFPPNTTIEAGGYLVVWCDETNSSTSGLHTGFGLDRMGDNVYLYNALTARVDAVSFGVQAADYSIGRVSAAWQLTIPSPGSSNIPASVGNVSELVINEWMANAVPGTSDWVELHNTNRIAPVALRNLYIGTSNKLVQLKALSFLAPGGYVQIFADELSGPTHVDFKLPATGGFIVLYDENGLQIDRVTYGPQSEGVSQGRLPDGWVLIKPFPGSGSPGASNYVASLTGPILNEVLAKHYRAATNSQGRVTDWVEIYNNSENAAELGGWSLSIDKASAGQWMFPSGTIVPAHSYLVVWCDEGRPETIAPGGYLNTGRAINADSGSVYLFNAGGQLIDSVEFGFQVEDKSIGRIGDVWQLLSTVTPGNPNAGAAVLGNQMHVRVNEWMAAPKSGDDWFELYNLDTLPVALGGMYLTDDPSLVGMTNFTVAALSFIGANGFVQWRADGNPSKGRDHVNFNLDSRGETITLYNMDLALVDRVSFGAQLIDISEGCLPDGAAERVNFPGTPTPGSSNYQPLPNAVINEVLTYPVVPMQGTVELFNPSSTPVPIGGWYLSNDERNFKKFRIANGTMLNPGEFLLFTEEQLNSSASLTPFSLYDPRGAEIWLAQADGFGNLTGFRAWAPCSAPEPSVAFGRLQTSVGVDFPAMAQTTLGLSNSMPRSSAVVINEIMYHPLSRDGTNDNVLDEYIELYNPGAANVALYDPANPANRWQLRGVNFTFPSNSIIPADGYVLVVNFDPGTNVSQLASFRARYNLGGFANILGPFEGQLDNGGEEIKLTKPGMPVLWLGENYVPYSTVDRVVYGDSTPWSSAADGNTNGIGWSLQRRAASAYGNEPLNWSAGPPNPGNLNTSGSIPVIVQQPVDQQVGLGSTVTFSVIATGDTPLTYLWQFNGAALLDETNATLTFYAVQPAQEGDYSVLVSGPGSAIRSASASLRVVTAPRIIQPPQSQGAILGANVTFAVYATGGGLTYQWQFDGNNLADQTNATLTLVDVDASDAGPYTVVISNTLSTVISDAAYLVLTAPAVLTQPQGSTNLVGSTVSLSITATGDLPLTYQWRKDGIPVFGATSSNYILTNAPGSASGMYDVQVINAAGVATSAQASVVVYVPVAITDGPVGVRVKAPNGFTNYGKSTTNITFTASAIGSGPMWYQWQRDGVDVPGADALTLTINNVSLADEGWYTVVVSNQYSSAVSTPARLMVTIDPAIRSQPEHQTVATGSVARFSVVALGNPLPLGYKWLRNRVGAPITNVVIAATNHTCIISNVNLTQSGAYTVTVTNSAYATPFALSANAYLTVVIPPTNQVVVTGTNVTFSVRASCYTNKLGYQWQFNGTNLAGMTSTNLTITNAQLAQCGIYTVLITNPANYGTAFSANLLPQTDAPIIIVPPKDQVVRAGGGSLFSVLAAGQAPIYYQWRHGLSDIDGATNATLNLANVQSMDEGDYSVIVTNSFGSVTSSLARLSISLPPIIVSHPASQTVAEWATVSFSVVAEGSPTLSYQWQFNGADIVGANTASFVINTAELAHQGEYRVVVSNIGGSVTSAPATLTISGPPIIITPPQAVVASPGQNVTFLVAASGTEPLRYSWYFNGALLAGATNMSYTCNSVHYTNAGFYSVRVENSAGFDQSGLAELNVRPRFVGYTLTNGVFVMDWEGVAGKSYNVETSRFSHQLGYRRYRDQHCHPGSISAHQFDWHK